MPYALGVDLGTTFTAAAAVHADGRVEMVALTPHRPAVPTVVALDADGRWLVGEPAERRGRTAPDRVSREFKRRLGDPAPILLGGSPATAEHLLGVVLADVVGVATRTLGEPPRHITITHPATWAAHKLSLLSAAVLTAGTGRDHVTFLPEPIAAAGQYAATERVAPGAVLAVYDLGGGTFDAAVLERTPTGFQFKGRPEGLDRAGGLDVDQAVLDHVDEALGGALSQLDRDDPELAGPLASLRAECVQAKEALSSDADTTVSVALPGLHHTVRITRAELERRIEPMLRDTVEALDRALTVAGVSPVQIDRILLVGGSSRIPLVAQLLATRFGRPVVVDAHPKHAVALGAAAVAAAQAFPSTVPVSPQAAPVTEAPAVPSHPDPPPAAPPVPGAARSGRMKVVAGVVAAAVIAATIGVLASRAGDDDEETASGDTTTTTAAEETTTTIAGDEPTGNDAFEFPTRPLDDDGAIGIAGLRGTAKFGGVDPAFLTRVRAVDPSATGAGIVAETYDAIVALTLAARTSGQDGSAMASALPDVTRFGTPCATPAACLEVIAGQGDADYDGASGRIELSDGGERTVSRWEVREVNRTGTVTTPLIEEAAATSQFNVGSSVPVSDVRPSDGVVRIGIFATDFTGTILTRLRAASRLAVDDVAAAGGIGVPVELAEPIDPGIFEEDQINLVGSLVDQGIDAVLTLELEPATTTALSDAGVLALQVVGTAAEDFLAANEDPGGLAGDLRFGFGPSIVSQGVLLGQLATEDGCTDVVMVTTNDDLDSTIADGEILELAMSGVGVGVADRVELPGLLAGEENADAVADAVDAVVEALDASDCVIYILPPLDEINAALLHGIAEAGVGPTDRFSYAVDGVLAFELIEAFTAIED